MENDAESRDEEFYVFGLQGQYTASIPASEIRWPVLKVDSTKVVLAKLLLQVSALRKEVQELKERK